MKTHCIVGGGAAGFFAAIVCAKNAPNSRTVLIEKTAKPLAKLLVSGGGRCNVTNACFTPKDLIQNYPRGYRELLGPFHTFGPREMVKWFEDRNIQLKTEPDGRIFPVSDSSQTIADCLMKAASEYGVELIMRDALKSVIHEDSFILKLKNQSISCDSLLLATGSSKIGHELAKELGHTIVEPIPSLFTFNIPSSNLLDLSGISIQDAEITLGSNKQRGPILLTHWGLSGPAVLKLSAFGARELHEKNYRALCRVNWLPEYTSEDLYQKLLTLKANRSSETLLPKKLWLRLLGGPMYEKSHAKIRSLTENLQRMPFQIEGKTTNKEEFVTAGGVALNEIHFKTMQSKLCKNLFFAGEILDIDGITGGFNFQNAWTTGYLAGIAMTKYP